LFLTINELNRRSRICDQLSIVKAILVCAMNTLSGLIGLWTESQDGPSGIWMSALSGVAAALAVALTLTVYFRMAYWSWRDLLKHGLAVLAAAALLAFVASDMRHAALAYLDLNPSKPAVEFEIRMPREILTAVSDSQVELHTDRNQTLALIDGVSDLADGRALLRGAVALNHRTADRMLVVNLPGKGTFEFRLRLPAEPHRTAQFGPWHLADRIALPAAGSIAAQDAYAIHYRVF
jgi:hypothetical protein